jgi:signal transduction histidine kinase
MPRSFQARLTLGFVSVVGLTLVLVSVLVINRLDDYFGNQQATDLRVRAMAVERLVINNVLFEWAPNEPVVGPTNRLNRGVVQGMTNPQNQRVLADLLAQADLIVSFGTWTRDGAGNRVFIPARDGVFDIRLEAGAQPGQARQNDASATLEPRVVNQGELPFSTYYVIQVQLARPYTFRASTLAAVTSLFAAIGLVAMGIAVVVAAFLARRFTTPLRGLTEASRALGEGDLASRVPSALVTAGTAEIAELSRQFNAMAERLEGSVRIVRRDRDRSRDFLADVSHELRTPIAALRTFNDLLRGPAAADSDARAEFLESSGQQIERLDWLAQNLLELSKLDSGLVLLALRPDDLRAAVESAVDQGSATARRRGIALVLRLPDAPVRILHDPQRIGQVVSNLIGNALKFTQRGGRVEVDLRAHGEGAVIEVSDTGVGIDAAELPRIFERFYRGTRANEARSSGSGLGLAIVKSIVDMHRGRLSVESRVGFGSRFRVVLPRDPEEAELSVPTSSSIPLGGPSDGDSRPGDAAAASPVTSVVGPQVANSSPPEASPVNQGQSG